MVTLDRIREPRAERLYPVDVLAGCESALVMFAAAFHGRQDAVWIADAGLRATCVDRDAGQLGEMVLAYPEGWEYVTGDAFAYAAATSRTWDVVSLDPPTSLFDICASLTHLWCSLARRAVIVGTGVGTEVDPPAGWQITETRARSNFQGGVYWTVLQPC